MNASDERERSSRVEREILEILERAEQAKSPVEHVQSTVRRHSVEARAQLAQRSAGNAFPDLLRSDIGKLAGAIVLAILAAALANASGILAMLLAIASAVLFFSLWFPGRGSSTSPSQRWRGQDLRGGSPFGHRDRSGPGLPKR